MGNGGIILPFTFLSHARISSFTGASVCVCLLFACCADDPASLLLGIAEGSASVSTASGKPVSRNVVDPATDAAGVDTSEFSVLGKRVS